MAMRAALHRDDTFSTKNISRKIKNRNVVCPPYTGCWSFLFIVKYKSLLCRFFTLHHENDTQATSIILFTISIYEIAIQEYWQVTMDAHNVLNLAKMMKGALVAACVRVSGMAG